jgi:N-formylmaleamate deformylase
MALWLAEQESRLVGPLVIVDSLPFLAAVMNPDATAESVKTQAEPMRKRSDEFVAGRLRLRRYRNATRISSARGTAMRSVAVAIGSAVSHKCSDREPTVNSA